MPGAPIQVGPFIGGLNTFSDATAIADNELTVCENFELDLDGSLKSRPPIQNLAINFPLGATGNVDFLGNFFTNTGVSYLIASDGLSSTYYFFIRSFRSSIRYIFFQSSVKKNRILRNI